MFSGGVGCCEVAVEMLADCGGTVRWVPGGAITVEVYTLLDMFEILFITTTTNT